MRVQFVDGSVVDYDLVTEAEVEGGKLLLKTVQGELVAELLNAEVLNCSLLAPSV